MRIITSLLILLGAFAASAQNAATHTFPRTECDFGAISEDLGPVSTDFLLVNTGSEPLAIVAARASCGCTTPQYNREPVAPGDTASITVSYDPAARPGRFTKYVSVQLSDGSQTKLYVKGTVIGSAVSVSRRFPVDCGGVLNLAKGVVMTGEVNHGQMRTVFLEAYNLSTDTLRPRVTDLPKYFEVTITPEAIAPGEQASFIFYFHSSKCPEYGLVNDSLAIWPDANAPKPCIVPTVALVKEDFSRMTPEQLKKAPSVQIDPDKVDFGRLDGNVATRTFTVTNTGKDKLYIRRAYSTAPAISVVADRTELKAGRKATVTVTVDPTQIKGIMLNSRISLITNDPNKSTTSVRVVGEL